MLIPELAEVYKTNSFIIFIDEQLSDSNGYLRSLHFLIRLSDDKIRNVVVWEPGKNCNKPLDVFGGKFEFIHPSLFSRTNELCCVFANDEKEEEYSYVDKYVEFEVPSIIVVNHVNFIPKAWRLSAKPLESKTQFTPHHFQVELNRYLSSTCLAAYQLPETKNLAFTEVCYLHHAITSEQPKTLPEIFSFENDALAISPIWDWAINLLILKEENKVTNIHAFIFNALRPHIERNKDVEKVANIFENFLKKHRYNIEVITSTRRKILKNKLQKYNYLLKETDEDILKFLLQIQMRKLQCQ